MDKEKVPCGAPPPSAAHSQSPELYNPIHMLTLSGTNANQGTDTLSSEWWSQKAQQSIKPSAQIKYPKQPDASIDRTDLQPKLLWMDS